MSLGVMLALGSALVWGSGDFCGGRASTKLDAFQVLGLSALSGIVALIVLTAVSGEPLVVESSLWWALAAGLSSAVGIAGLYQGLSVGSAAVVAPTAAVVAALMPVIFGAVTTGVPRAPQVAGFALALIGIFLVARTSDGPGRSDSGIRLGALAGLGFGGFLILIAQVSKSSVFVPLAVARGVMFLAALCALAVRRRPWPGLTASPLGLMAGVLDAGGTALYLMAQHYVRMDVAAVLSSFYPAATVVLARVITREPVTTTQWVGAGVCVAAVGLIAL
jgi:drug/metabolite transporter (DMT)-like permease